MQNVFPPNTRCCCNRLHIHRNKAHGILRWVNNNLFKNGIWNVTVVNIKEITKATKSCCPTATYCTLWTEAEAEEDVNSCQFSSLSADLYVIWSFFFFSFFPKVTLTFSLILAVHWALREHYDAVRKRKKNDVSSFSFSWVKGSAGAIVSSSSCNKPPVQLRSLVSVGLCWS